MMKYEIIENGIIATDENGKVYLIPTDPANSDYQAYLNKDTLASELIDPALLEKPKK